MRVKMAMPWMACILFAMQANAKVCDGFASNQRIPVGAKTAGGVSKADFNSLLDRVQSLYSGEVQRRGGNLVIDRKWDDAELNAYADRDGSTWTIYMFGGLARHHAMTKDGFTLVACHEMGHHLGGAPKYGGQTSTDWAANEGQADYFGTLKCMRRVFAEDRDPVSGIDQNEAIVRAMAVDPVAKAACEREHSGRADQQICIRSAMAGLSLGNVLQELGQTAHVHFNTPNHSQVAATDDEHPEAQCRLDTYFHGALCGAAVSEELSDTDYRPGACVSANQPAGLRPRCWFKPWYTNALGRMASAQ